MPGGSSRKDPSSGSDQEPQYHMKTLCLARKSLSLPSREEHGFLIFHGLGARRWKCAINCNAEDFKQTVLSIYPQLRSVPGYSLWTASTDGRRNLERIPESVDDPRRMREYLGTQFTGSIVIVPSSDIVLAETEPREPARPQETPQQDGGEIQSPICLVCGRTEGVFHGVTEESAPGSQKTVSQRLTDILGFDFLKCRRRLAGISADLCGRCLRSIKELDSMEEEVKESKEGFLHTFLSTTIKYNKLQRPPPPPPLPPMTWSEYQRPSASGGGGTDTGLAEARRPKAPQEGTETGLAEDRRANKAPQVQDEPRPLRFKEHRNSSQHILQPNAFLERHPQGREQGRSGTEEGDMESLREEDREAEGRKRRRCEMRSPDLDRMRVHGGIHSGERSSAGLQDQHQPTSFQAAHHDQD